MAGEPGTRVGLRASGCTTTSVAVIASDNWAIEVLPGENPSELLDVHMVLIRDMGMTLGEILDLDELADDCAADGVYEFFVDGAADQVHERRRLADQPARDQVGHAMDFSLPAELVAYLGELDEFIESVVKPIEQRDDNIRFFDHRREDARTDWDRGGLPNDGWEELLGEVRRLADEAGHYRYAFPKEYGGRDGTNLGMAIIR